MSFGKTKFEGRAFPKSKPQAQQDAVLSVSAACEGTMPAFTFRESSAFKLGLCLDQDLLLKI